MMNNSNRIILSLVLLAMTAFLVPQSVSVAATATQSTDYSALTLSNDYIEATLGVAGSVSITGDDNTSGTLSVGGRYSVMSIKGDPDNTGDDNKELIPWAPWAFGPLGYWKIKVGEKIVIVGAGTDGSGDWSTTNPPTKYSAPVSGNNLGPGGPYIEGEWDTAGETPVGVKINMSLVRDQVRFALTITNRATTTQSIGLGMFGIPKVSGGSTGGYPFIPGVGMTRANGVSDSFSGTIFSGSKIPDHFEVYDSLDDPIRVARYTLDEQDCTVPDYVAIGEWESGGIIATSVWLPNGYTPDPLKPLEYPVCLLQWNQKALSPGSSRTYVTYYGVGAASELWTYTSNKKVVRDSVVASVQGPRALKYDSTNTAVYTQNLSPDPFTVSAYVYNTTMDSGPYDLEEVSAYLYLPEGLTLASGTASQDIGDVPINTESGAVTWSVKPTGTRCGELEYYVVFSDKNGWSQTVSRKIMVPATKKTELHYGYQMVSVPFEFNNPTFSHAFGMTSGYNAVYYDVADAKDYVTLSQLEPGKAFWVNVYSLGKNGKKTYSLATDAAIVGEYYGKQYKEQYVDLLSGWNMVGNPFVYPVYVGQIMVYNKTTNTTYSFDQAVKKGWLSRTIYGWNIDTSAYETLTTNDAMLLPWKGYWVRAKAAVTLVFRPSVFPDSGVTSLLGGY